MKTRHPLISALFNAVKMQEAMSSDVITQTIALINVIPEFALFRQDEILHYKKLKEIYPTLPVSCPEEFSLSSQDDDGFTALVWAARRGHTAIVKALLDARVDLHSTTSKGETALMWSAYNGHADITGMLIKSGANLDAQDKDGETALLCASRRGYADVASILLQQRASINLLNAKNESALDKAIQQKHLSMIHLLLQHGAKVTSSKLLSDVLLTCDQRDPSVLASLKKLCQQQQDDKQSMLEEKVSLSLISYEKCLSNVHCATSLEIDKILEVESALPVELRNTVMGYDAPLSRGFFASMDKVSKQDIESFAAKLLADAKPKRSFWPW